MKHYFVTHWALEPERIPHKSKSIWKDEEVKKKYVHGFQNKPLKELANIIWWNAKDFAEAAKQKIKKK